jgi:acyl-CoA synthetase (AMP-forming)/AMP-acid ligase II
MARDIDPMVGNLIGRHSRPVSYRTGDLSRREVGRDRQCRRRPRTGAELAATDVIAFCRSRLAHFQCPTSVELVQDLPRNATSKVLKRALHDPYWARQDRTI